MTEEEVLHFNIQYAQDRGVLCLEGRRQSCSEHIFRVSKT